MIKFWILPQSITIKSKDQSWIISSTDPRFESVKEMLQSNQLELAVAEINYSSKLGEGFSSINNQIQYLGYPFPHFLADQFVNNKISKKTFLGFANLWVNLSKKENSEESIKALGKIIEAKAYPLSNDGFIFCSAVLGSENLPLYSYCNSPSMIQTLFDQKKNLEEIGMFCFGNFNNKTRKTMIHHIFKKGKVRGDLLALAHFLKDLIAEENVIKTIESVQCLEKIPQIYRITDSQSLLKSIDSSVIFKQICANTSNFINVLNHLTEIVIQIRSHVEKKDFEVPKFKNLQEMSVFLERELTLLKNKNRIIPLTTNEAKWNNKKLETFGLPNLKFVAPEETIQLAKWSNEMFNCVRGYAESVLRGNKRIYGFVNSEGKCLFNVAVDGNKTMGQLAGKRNSEVPIEIRRKIVNFLISADFILDHHS